MFTISCKRRILRCSSLISSGVWLSCPAVSDSVWGLSWSLPVSYDPIEGSSSGSKALTYFSCIEMAYVQRIRGIAAKAYPSLSRHAEKLLRIVQREGCCSSRKRCGRCRDGNWTDNPNTSSQRHIG